MQEALALELARIRGIGVDELRPGRAAMTALGREGEIDEAVDAIRYFLSEESSYVTGQAINVCGGLLVT